MKVDFRQPPELKLDLVLFSFKSFVVSLLPEDDLPMDVIGAISPIQI